MKRIVLLSWWKWAAAESFGEPECPCIGNSSGLIEQLQPQLITAGYPSNYGLLGCDAYDVNLSTSGCRWNEKPQCQNPWCFVDMTRCPINKARCEAAGGIPGSTVSPDCRTRPYAVRSFLNLSVYYSYETCGSVNMYDRNRHSVNVGGTVIRVVIDPVAPWVVRRTGFTRAQEYGGPSYDFFLKTLELFEPKPVLSILDGWATTQSKQKFQSDYTACVHDVALGTFDMCIADIWLTPERHLLARFVPPLRQDYFYLVVPRKIEGVAFWTRLKGPFLPFTPAAWAGIVAFLCLMSLLLWLVRVCEDEHDELGSSNSCRVRCSWRMGELGRMVFHVFHDFLLGQSSILVEKGPVRKLFSTALAFFILIVLASYTASLASILVIQRQNVGTINSINEAIAQDVPICVPSVLLSTFSYVFPRASFVESLESRNGPRLLYSGACSALILSQATLDNMYAGQIREHDCEAVASGSITEEVGRCERDHLGNLRNDCNLIRVGDLLWSAPISFPVSERMAHSMSWAFTYAMTSGLMEETKKLNADVFPVSKCQGDAERSDEDGLTLDDLSGTIFIALLIAGCGLICLAGTAVCRALGRSLWGTEEMARTTATASGSDIDSGRGPKRPSGLKEGSRLACLEEQPLDDQIVPLPREVEADSDGVCGCFRAEIR